MINKEKLCRTSAEEIKKNEENTIKFSKNKEKLCRTSAERIFNSAEEILKKMRKIL